MRFPCILPCLIVAIAPHLATAEADSGQQEEAIRAASARYCDAFNAMDAEGLASQWTSEALLYEGGGMLRGRDRIVESLLTWRRSHPKANLAIEVADIDMLGETAARIRGRMLFSVEPGAEPHLSDFDSLRVLEQGRWKLAESVVGPSAAALLDELAWLLGGWRSTDAQSKTVHEIRYERSLGGHVIVGRGRITARTGDPVETMEVIHADPRDGIVRSSLWDSTGARATGSFDSDGTTFNRVLEGTSGAIAGGQSVRWIQVITPDRGEKMIQHSIDRLVGGLPMPDGQPVVFERIK